MVNLEKRNPNFVNQYKWEANNWTLTSGLSCLLRCIANKFRITKIRSQPKFLSMIEPIHCYTLKTISFRHRMLYTKIDEGLFLSICLFLLLLVRIMILFLIPEGIIFKCLIFSKCVYVQAYTRRIETNNGSLNKFLWT